VSAQLLSPSVQGWVRMIKDGQKGYLMERGLRGCTNMLSIVLFVS